MHLEELIRTAAASPAGLQHLTLAPSEAGWQAAFRPKNRVEMDEKGRKITPTIGYRIHIADDPVAALLGVLAQQPKAGLDEDDLALI